MIFYQSELQDFTLLQGDCLHILPTINDKSINMIFADSPYFLSNDGLTVKNGIKPNSILPFLLNVFKA